MGGLGVKKGAVRDMHTVRQFRVVALLALVLLGLVATTAAPVGAVTVFQNSKVAVGIADGWVQTTSGLDDSVIGQWSIDDGSAIFQIVALKVPSGTSSLDYAVQQADALTSLSGYKELRRDFVTSGDQQAPRLDYLIDKDGTPIRAQSVFLTHGSDAYLLSFFTKLVDHQDYVDEADVMVYSFTFV